MFCCFSYAQHEFVDRNALHPILMVPLIRVLEVRPAPMRTSVSEEADDDDKPVEARERKVSDGKVARKGKREERGDKKGFGSCVHFSVGCKK